MFYSYEKYRLSLNKKKLLFLGFSIFCSLSQTSLGAVNNEKKDSIKVNYNDNKQKNYLNYLELFEKDRYLRKYSPNKINYNFEGAIQFNSFLSYLIAELDEVKSEDKSNLTNLEIEADEQSNNGDLFIAKGDVIINYKEGTLSADKLLYDREFKKIIIQGNITFRSLTQYINADQIKYDFLNKKGYILDAYGSIDFNSLSQTLTKEKYDSLSKKNYEENGLIKDVTLANTSKFSIDINRKLPFSGSSMDTELSKVYKNRFKTNRIDINNNTWSSKKLFLTNDPFNKPQAIIENNDFVVKIEDGKSYITTKWSRLILEEKIKVPLGGRNIANEDLSGRWSVGYDKKNNDGLFINRKSKRFKIGENSNATIDFKKTLNIQRIYSGSTESFSQKNDSLFGTKIKQDANTLDYFGISSRLKNKGKKWDLILDAELNSLDLDKFGKIIKSNSILKRRLIESTNENQDLTMFANYGTKTSNGSLGEILVKSSYGVRYNIYRKKYFNRNTQKINISAGYGRYEALSQRELNDLINKNRLNISIKQENLFALWKPKKEDFITKENKFSPYIIPTGLYWLANGNLDLFRYEDGKKQDLLELKTGPKLVFGNFKRDFFDYTSFNIYPRIRFSEGESPFTFDQIVDKKVIELNFTQQIYKALALSFSGNLNIEDNISEEDRFFNEKLLISWNRRAYNFSLYYNFDKENGGINFNLFNFDFKGNGEEF